MGLIRRRRTGGGWRRMNSLYTAILNYAVLTAVHGAKLRKIYNVNRALIPVFLFFGVIVP